MREEVTGKALRLAKQRVAGCTCLFFWFVGFFDFFAHDVERAAGFEPFNLLGRESVVGVKFDFNFARFMNNASHWFVGLGWHAANADRIFLVDQVVVVGVGKS